MKPVIRSGLPLAGALLLASMLPAQGLSQPPTAGSSSSLEQLKRDADAAYRSRDFAEAVRLTTQVLDQSPNDAVAHYLRGSARVEQGIAGGDPKLIRDGIDDARLAIQADGAKNVNFYLPYLYGMSHLTALEGETNHAETAVTVATKVASRPGIADASKSNILYQRGLAHAKLGDYSSAADDLRQTLQLDPNHLAAGMALGDALFRGGEMQPAEEAYTAAVGRFPDNPLVFNNRGMFYQSQQRHEEAIADFTKAIELNPNQLQTHLNRGFARLNSGDYPGAQADFTQAIQLQPDHAPAYSLRGTSKLLQSNIRDAMQDYLRVIELRPSHAPARADIAFAYFFAQHYDTAAQAFEQALLLDPESRYLIPWRYAALTLAERGESADQAYRSITEKPAEERDWFDLLTLYFMGQIEERDLMTSIEAEDASLRDAQLCEAYYFIGLRRQTDGQGDAALYFRRAVESRATQLSAYRAARIELDRIRK